MKLLRYAINHKQSKSLRTEEYGPFVNNCIFDKTCKLLFDSKTEMRGEEIDLLARTKGTVH